MKTVTRRAFVGLALAVGLGGCLSPTLPPLPPPNEPDLQYLAPEQLQLTGQIATNRSALVLAINARNGDVAGQVVRDGRYRFVLNASPGDSIEFWYELGADVSESLFFEAPPYDEAADGGATLGDAGAFAAPSGAADSGTLDAATPEGADPRPADAPDAGN